MCNKQTSTPWPLFNELVFKEHASARQIVAGANEYIFDLAASNSHKTFNNYNI